MAAFHLGGCSMEQIHSSSHAWQRNECDKLMDQQVRNRCLTTANTSNEEYKRQSREAMNQQ
jgi:hypothetical protein